MFSCSVTSDPVTPWTEACQASLTFTISWSLLKLKSIEWVMSPYHLILCRPFLLLPSIFPSIGVFSNELALHIKWPKYWSFSFSIRPSKEYSGLISLRIDGFDLLAVQGIFKGLLSTTVLKYQFFSAQPSFWSNSWHLYTTTGKTIALTGQTFVGKVMSLLFNRLSRFVIALILLLLFFFFNFQKRCQL